MKKYTPDLAERTLMHLIKVHLWDIPADTALLETLDSSCWEKVYTLAWQQGVQGITYSVVQPLSDRLKLSRETLLNWAAGTFYIREENEELRRVLSAICHQCTTHELSPVLLKGFSTAALYPKPELRESGDIDLWFPDRSTEADEMFRNLGCKVDHSLPKHSVCRFKGVTVENHHTLLGLFVPQNVSLESTLYDVWKKEGGRPLPVTDNVSITHPGPDFSMLFNGRHICAHLCTGLFIRNLIDWAMLCKEYHGTCDKDLLSEKLEAAGLVPALSMISCAAEKYIGMPEEYSFFDTSGYDGYAGRLMDMILHPVPKRVKGRGPLHYLTGRWKYYVHDYWVYHLVYGESFPRHLFNSVKAVLSR